MTYIVSFLEGIVTFISPCILPMIPIYLAYFAGTSGVDSTGTEEDASKDSAFGKTLKNALGFVLGFTIVFVLLGAFAGTIGAFLRTYQTAVNIISGIIVIIFGLNFIGVFNIGFLNQTHRLNNKTLPVGFFSSVVFGIIFSIGWTPCVGAFLGSALLMAAQQASMVQGILMLICYSLGLGVPFVLSAVLIQQLEGAFKAIKRHYRIINIVCGSFLIVIGLLMAFGLIGEFLSLLTF